MIEIDWVGAPLRHLSTENVWCNCHGLENSKKPTTVLRPFPSLLSNDDVAHKTPIAFPCATQIGYLKEARWCKTRQLPKTTVTQANPKGWKDCKLAIWLKSFHFAQKYVKVLRRVTQLLTNLMLFSVAQCLHGRGLYRSFRSRGLYRSFRSFPSPQESCSSKRHVVHERFACTNHGRKRLLPLLVNRLFVLIFTDVGDFFGQLPYDGGFLSGHTLLMSVALKMVHKKHRFYPCLGQPSFQRRPTPENLSEESLATGRSLHWALPDKTIDMLLIWSRPKYNPQKVKVMEFMR